MAIPIITPVSPLAKQGKSLTHFVSDQDVTWLTDTGILLTNILVRSVDWTAPNKTGNWHLYAENAGHEIRTILIVVESILPNYWEYQNPIDAGKKKLEFEPIDGPVQHRLLSLYTQHKWELGADDSSYEERNEMKAFWDWHDPGKSFLMNDPVIGETRRYETDSNWSEIYKAGDGYSWKFKIKEVWPYTLVA